VNNTEIRLRILFGCYAEMYHGIPATEHTKRLEGVKPSVVTANTAYLIDKGLLGGEVDHYANGTLYARIGRIMPGGVDIVEEITSRSVDELEDAAAREIRDSPYMQLSFWEKCVHVATVCRVATEVAGQIFAAI